MSIPKMEAFIIWLGLGIGNFTQQALTNQNWEFAFDACFFQASGIIALFVYHKFNVIGSKR